MKSNLIKIIIVAISSLLYSCSESELEVPENDRNEIFAITTNSIAKINIDEQSFIENFQTFDINAKVAARNNNYIVIAGQYSPSINEDLIIHNYVEDDLSVLDIDALLDYSEEEERFEVNDVMIYNQKLYVVGIKYKYFEESLLQLIEIDLKKKLITGHSEQAHENVILNKYIKLIHDGLIYINFNNNLEVFTIQDLAKANESVIETSYFPGNLMMHDEQDLLYYDFGTKQQFHISRDNFKKSSEKPIANLAVQILIRERPLANFKNNVFGFYLKDSPFNVGIFQYDLENMRVEKLLQNEDYNNIMSEEGYFVIQSKFIRAIEDKIVFQGVIFNEEKSVHENIITVLDSDFNRLQSHQFEILSEDIIAIL